MNINENKDVRERKIINMMISPDYYIMMHKNDSFEELIKERKSLQRKIASLEKIVFAKENDHEEPMVMPGPDVQYQMGLQYLSKLCEFICEKYNREVVHGEDEDPESDCY